MLLSYWVVLEEDLSKLSENILEKVIYKEILKMKREIREFTPKILKSDII